jgi:protein-S-isoprenylcysteine O-methyltransferase Ste14
MKIQVDAIGYATLVLLYVSWFSFALIFLLRKKPAQAEETKRAPAAILGIALQAVAYAMIWSHHRSEWWPFPPSTTGEVILATLVIVLAWASSWWCLRSVQTLGKQWTVQARLIRGHELVTEGPYGIVRNPIYLGMFGLLIATGLAASRPWTLLIAVVVFLVGNQIRIRAEEKLLRESFGEQFEDYARRVPAFLPRIL